MICKGCGKDEELRLGFCFDCAEAGELRSAMRTVPQHLLRMWENIFHLRFHYALFDLRWAWQRATNTGDYADDGYFAKEVLKRKMSEIDLMQTTDHVIWGREFVRRFGGDEELMASWFASAMMAMHDKLKGPPNGDAMQYQIDHAAPAKPIEYIGKDGRSHFQVTNRDCICGESIINDFEWEQHLKHEEAKPALSKIPGLDYSISDPTKCPKCGGRLTSRGGHGEWCPNVLCKFGWEIELDGTPLMHGQPTDLKGQLFNLLTRHPDFGPHYIFSKRLAATETMLQALEGWQTSTAMMRKVPPSPEMSECLAKRFHELYEELAVSFGYETRKESAKPWEQVPEKNKLLMIAVCKQILAEF